jgi:serine/threonine protein phosphatase PrpC
LARALGAYGVWWTAGSERVAACALITSGLPGPDEFVAMLDGDWAGRGWKSGSFQRTPAQAARLAARSAAISDPGKTREINEDSFACRDDAGIWIVADGLGGHQAGDIASRMVTSVIDALPPQASLEARVARIVDDLQVVNGCLQVLAEGAADVTMAASTVVVLILGETAAACVWAGDSRIYLLRGGELRQLTADHAGQASDQPQAPPNDRRDHAITRAVGGPEPLMLDVHYEDLRPGDRYLLCTDGLYSEIDGDDLVRAISVDEIEAAISELKGLALGGSAPDNLTAVVIDVTAVTGESEPDFGGLSGG